MTIEELKQHCINTIKMSEAIESIPNVKITDSRSLQEHKIVLQLIEAWGKVREEIKYHADNIKYTDAYRDGFEVSLKIIDKHLAEVENESKNENIRRNESLC